MSDYLFVNPFLHPPGGGEGVANWMLQALVERGRVTVLTWDPPDFAAIDAYYGTSLRGRPMEVLTVAPGVRRVLRASGLPHRLLALRWLQRRAAQLRPGFRHAFSAFNLLDLGEPPSVQYVHHPVPDGPPENPWSDRLLPRLIWPAYMWLLDRVYLPQRQRWEANLTLANSHWTARALLSQGFPQAPRVLYPPPLGRPVHSPEGARRFGFVSVGRLDPSKNWVDLIAIVEGVRARGYPVSLTLAGSRFDPVTCTRIQALAETRRSWLTLLLDPPREVLDLELAEHAFGLHGMKDEHYGMAVAELLLSECLTFVHDSGGQVEIVTQPEARYRSVEDAVEKICAVLDDPALHARLQEGQKARAGELTRERFLADFTALVDSLERADSRL